ncbi:hypothetical protein PR048_000820 [Dryococelus australis]|uniref:Uncharacterized protein n=1 Tax=Dryococelus australis TaxID=614101 RepID=A0ABQ9IFP3_9NEOP|nr:hypothetical protein PR048_000820 [Dryococelus australis]
MIEAGDGETIERLKNQQKIKELVLKLEAPKNRGPKTFLRKVTISRRTGKRDTGRVNLVLECDTGIKSKLINNGRIFVVVNILAHLVLWYFIIALSSRGPALGKPIMPLVHGDVEGYSQTKVLLHEKRYLNSLAEHSHRTVERNFPTPFQLRCVVWCPTRSTVWAIHFFFLGLFADVVVLHLLQEDLPLLLEDIPLAVRHRIVFHHDGAAPHFHHHSPPSKANRVRLLSESLPDLRTWESSRTMPLVGWFSRGSPVSPALHYGAGPFSPRFTLIGSQDTDVRGRPNYSTCALDDLSNRVNSHDHTRLVRLSREDTPIHLTTSEIFERRQRRSELKVEQRLNAKAEEARTPRENHRTTATSPSWWVTIGIAWGVGDRVNLALRFPRRSCLSFWWRARGYLPPPPTTQYLALCAQAQTVRQLTGPVRWCSGLTTCLPPGRNGFHSRRGCSPIFACGTRAAHVPGLRVFSEIFHFPRPFIPAAPYLHRFTLIGSQNVDVKSRRNLVTHCIIIADSKCHRRQCVCVWHMLVLVEMKNLAERGQELCFSFALASGRDAGLTRVAFAHLSERIYGRMLRVHQVSHVEGGKALRNTWIPVSSNDLLRFFIFCHSWLSEEEARRSSAHQLGDGCTVDVTRSERLPWKSDHAKLREAEGGFRDHSCFFFSSAAVGAVLPVGRENNSLFLGRVSLAAFEPGSIVRARPRFPRAK